ncbi:MAG TPA: hypothetical protein VG405_13110 [Solirubrobacteraceae bacterium]|jgi:hypothetical protein|nr:hypothetical protein [Solirubrobacteraceae bacterium]
MTAKRALSRFPAPDQPEAEARAWEVVRTALAQREPADRRRRYRSQMVALAGAILLAGSLVLSPAGATVDRLISRALGVQHAARTLVALPTPGRLLISGPHGTWTVGSSGAKRWVGPWTDAMWSPHGRYLAVTRHDQLAAVTPLGVTQWVLQRPHLSDPRWYPPAGYRVAYLSGTELRAVAGDGSGDHLVAASVARVAPAWRPGHAYQLAYISGAGMLRVRDADSGARVWSARPGVRVRTLAWSGDGGRLLALSAHTILVYSSAGRLISARPAPGEDFIRGGALSPDGRTISIVAGRSSRSVLVYGLPGRGGSSRVRRVLAGAGLGQVAFSPNGRWLLITWPAADEWVFVRVAGAPRIAALSRIEQHFGSGKGSQFPRLDGWCCSAAGADG